MKIIEAEIGNFVFYPMEEKKNCVCKRAKKLYEKTAQFSSFGHLVVKNLLCTPHAVL